MIQLAEWTRAGLPNPGSQTTYLYNVARKIMIVKSKTNSKLMVEWKKYVIT